MNAPLQGINALVTGASRGMGREIACRLAKAGALVCVHFGRGRAEADETVRLIAHSGGSAFALGADVSKVAQITALFTAMDAELERRGRPGLDISRHSNVNAVAPGSTATDFTGGIAKDPAFAKMMAGATPYGRVANPEDIGGIVAFLASPDGNWVTGQTIQASGGLHL